MSRTTNWHKSDFVGDSFAFEMFLKWKCWNFTFFRFDSELYLATMMCFCSGLVLQRQPAVSTCSLSTLFRTETLRQRKAALEKKCNPRRAADQEGLQQSLHVGGVFTGETTGHNNINSGISTERSWKMRFYQADQSQSWCGADSPLWWGPTQGQNDLMTVIVDVDSPLLSTTIYIYKYINNCHV